ncbi:DUF6053 domain-containing protein [Lysobacter enzymogenes]|uniref:DUF6053 domain-containing protein n=1 Tax=Lysobacter enzymogenes TaxID=69 RepID=UPI003CCD59E5
MGGPSGPMPSGQIAATGPEGIGPEGPPTPKRPDYSPSPAWNASPSASAAACTTGITRS